MKPLNKKLITQNTKIKNFYTRVFDRKSLVLSETTPYEIIAEFNHAKIRYYSAEKKKYKEPLVFISPLAISMAIYDLYPYRSLVKYFQQQGFDVYLVDWGNLNYTHKSLNFMYFIDQAIPACIKHIINHSKSELISLHGWSMAGVFVTLYTALQHPSYVKNLIVFGSPMDSYASGRVGTLFEKANEIISKNSTLQQKIYDGHIPKQFIHTPGFLNALGFKILDPKGWFESKKQLLHNLDNTQILNENATLSDFLNNMIDYPGGINQDMIFNVWLRNPLKNGHIQLGNKLIELKNIDCSLLVGAGSSDQIVSAEAAKPLTELTNSQDVTFTLIPGGHLGLMSNQKSANTFWPTLSKWLEQRSTKL